MDTDAYLNRINYSGPLVPTAATLASVHRAHLLTVPFENLDIHMRRPLTLDVNAFFEKIVRRRRGGFCYELNGLFAELLRTLGFEVSLLSARVIDKGHTGPEFDHLTLVVELAERWLADVGFGDSFLEPLRLDHPGEQVQGNRACRLTHSEDEWTMSRRTSDSVWRPCYHFTLRPRRLEEFAGMFNYHQTSPDSIFTGDRLCSLATEDGRTTISGSRFIITHGNERQVRVLEDEADYERALREHFGVDLIRTA